MGRTLSNDCVQIQRLQTPFEADTVVYGTMFTVQTSSDSITVLSMEISANPVGTEMDVAIYTKLGDYVGVETDPSQWEKIVDASLTPAREGHGTPIPEDQFKNFTMGKNELRAFFVSLKSSDLRYKRSADGTEAGQPFVSDGYLSVNSGIGLAEYGFSNQIFPSRLFSGIFYYSHATDCSAPSSKVLVTYSFLARSKESAVSRDQLIDELNSLVDGAVKSLLDSDLSTIRDEYKTEVETVTSATSISEQANCPVAGWSDCALIDCKVTLTHSTTIAGGNLNYLLLSSSDKVTTIVREGALDVEYAGYATLKTSLLVALQGVPAGVALDKEQKGFVEEVATAYAAEQTVGAVDATIVGTTITNQRGPGLSPQNRRNLQNSSAVDGWIELTIDVLAIHVPPYTGAADFGETVLSSFRSKQNDFVDDLKTARYRPDSQVQGDRGEYFAGITNVNVRSVEDAPNGGTGDVDGASTGEKIYGLSTAVFIAICVAVLVFAAVWIWFINRRAKKAGTNEGEVEFVDSTGRKRRRSSVMFMFGGKIPPLTNEETGKVGEVFAMEGIRQDTIQTAELLGSRGRSRSIRNVGDSLHKSDGRQELARKGSNDAYARAGVSPSGSRDHKRETSHRRLASRSRSRDSPATSKESIRTSDYGSYDESMPISRHNSRDPSKPNTRNYASNSATNAHGGTTDHKVQAKSSSASEHARNMEGTNASRKNSRDTFVSNSSSHVRSPNGPYLQSMNVHDARMYSEAPSVSRHTSRDPSMSNASSHMRALAVNASYPRDTADHNVRVNPSSHNRQPILLSNSDSIHSTRATRTIGTRFDKDGSSHIRQPMPTSASDTQHSTRATRTIGTRLDANGSAHHRLPVSFASSDTRHTTRAARTTGIDIDPLREASSAHNRLPVSSTVRESGHSTRAARTTFGGDVARASEASSHARARVSASTHLTRTTGLPSTPNDGGGMPGQQSAAMAHGGIPGGDSRVQISQSMRGTRTIPASHDARMHAHASMRGTRTQLPTTYEGGGMAGPQSVALAPGTRGGDVRVQISQSMRGTRTIPAMHDARIPVHASKTTQVPPRLT